MRGSLVGAVCLVCVVFLPVHAAEEEIDVDVVFDTVVDAVGDCLVKVSVYPQYSEGRGPGDEGAHYFPGLSSGYFAGLLARRIDADALNSALAQERPVEVSGFLVSSDRVVVQDFTVHPRFINRIEVEVAGKRYQAHTDAWSPRGQGRILRLERPVEGVTPLEFDAEAPGPYCNVGFMRQGPHWVTSVASVTPFSRSLVTDDTGRKRRNVRPNSLLVTTQGTPVALPMCSEVPPDDSWKGSPLEKELLRAADVKLMQEALVEKIDAGVALVSFRFRAPPKEDESRFFGGSRIRYWSGDDEKDQRERWSAGFLLSPQLVLIPIKCSRDALARLESITVTAKGETADAQFVGALEHYHLLLATLSSPLAGAQPLKLSPRDLNEMHREFVLAADMDFSHGKRKVYVQHDRVRNWTLGRRGLLHPSMGRGTPTTFYFDREGHLLGVPLVTRSRETDEYRFSGYGEALICTAGTVKRFVDEPDEFVDASLRPLSEREAKMLVWLGVELQPLDEQLAQLNQVSRQTRGGEFGAVITHIYQGSPAERVGLEVGDVLLRLTVANQPEPLEIEAEEHRVPEFPWDQFPGIQVPVELLQHLPAPWPPRRNRLTEALTGIGPGKEADLSFARDGQEKTVALRLELGPEDYHSTESHKSESLGATVKSLTYEVRRFYRLMQDAPGVIVSKIETGGKAAVGGMRPYELVTHVNGQPVADLEGFREALAPGGVMELTVKYLAKTRLIKVTLEPEKAEEAEEAEETEE